MTRWERLAALSLFLVFTGVYSWRAIGCFFGYSGAAGGKMGRQLRKAGLGNIAPVSSHVLVFAYLLGLGSVCDRQLFLMYFELSMLTVLDEAVLFYICFL